MPYEITQCIYHAAEATFPPLPQPITAGTRSGVVWLLQIKGPLQRPQNMVIGPPQAIKLHESRSLIESNVNG